VYANKIKEMNVIEPNTAPAMTPALMPFLLLFGFSKFEILIEDSVAVCKPGALLITA